MGERWDWGGQGFRKGYGLGMKISLVDGYRLEREMGYGGRDGLGEGDGFRDECGLGMKIYWGGRCIGEGDEFKAGDGFGTGGGLGMDIGLGREMG